MTHDRSMMSLQYAARVVGLSAIYFVAGKLGLSLAFVNESASAVWPPSGIALAAVMVLGYRIWPGIFLGAFLVNMSTTGEIPSSLGIGVGNTIEAVCGAWMMHHLAGGRRTFERAAGVAKFILFAGIISTALCATIGVTSLSLSGAVDWTQYERIWLTWWLGDISGVLIVAPAILLWMTDRMLWWNWAVIRPRLWVFGCLFVVGVVLFGGVLGKGPSSFPLAIIGLPILLWPAFRFGPREAATATCVLTATAIWGTMHDLGPFVQESRHDALLLLQTFMTVNAAISLLFAAVISQRGYAEVRLRESEQSLRTIFRQAAVGLCEKDDKGRYQLVNDRFCEIVGYTAQELLGRTFREISHPDDMQVEQMEFDRLVIGKSDHFAIEKRYLHKSGEEVWVSLTVSALRDVTGAMRSTIGSIEDITERKTAGERELEAAARLRAVVETAVDGIITIDERGTIESANKAALTLFGYEYSEVVGKNVMILMPEPYRSDHERQLMNYQKTGLKRIIGIGREAEGLRKDGSVFPIELAVSETRIGKRRIFTGIVRNITERKHAEERLQNAVAERTAELASANQQLLLEISQRQVAEGMIAGETHILELIATGASPHAVLDAICEMVEQRCEAVRCSIHVPVPEAGMTTPGLPARRRHFGNIELSDLPLPTTGEFDSRRVLEDVGVDPQLRAWSQGRSTRAVLYEPVQGTKGERLGAVLLGLSESRSPNERESASVTSAARLAAIIIEQSRAEEAIRRQLTELAHVSRLATMGDMASGLAHELNQPLCAIVNYAGACLETIEAKKPAKELHQAMEHIAQQAERAGEVIRRLRDFVRRREPQRAPVDMNQVVRDVLDLIQTELRQCEIDVRLHLGKRLPRALADAVQIQQVVLNLIRNAIEAMSEPGANGRRLSVRTSHDGEFVEVEIADTGIGIGEELREQVFESFYTNKPQGMGMGLSISKSILTVHRGRIWVTPNEPQGASFHFSLPLAGRSHHGD